MFTTVLRYDFGAVASAVDVSGRHAHGKSTALSHSPDGPQPGRGAAVFTGDDSRIRILQRDDFRRLTALKIEMTVWLDHLGERENLVEGYLSFAFFVNADGSLCGTARGGGASGVWAGADSIANSPDGIPRRVPVGRWTTLTYQHDGFGTLSLLIDGSLAAVTTAAPAPLPSVGWRGVHIGNWPDADRFALRGRVSDVQIWRWDAQAVTKQFFTRPPSPCWRTAFDVANDPGERRARIERLTRLYRCVVEAQRDVIAAIRRTPGGPERIRILAEDYRREWAQGTIGEPDMLALIEDFLASLSPSERRVFDDALERMRRCVAAMEIDIPADTDWESCDPEFARLIRNLMPLVEA